MARTLVNSIDSVEISNDITNSVAAEEPKRAQVGDVIASMLDGTAFQAERDTTWVLASGQAVPGSDYASLVGPNVPDLRGVFLRGKSYTRGASGNPDGDLAVGTYTADAIRNITGGVNHRNLRIDQFQSENGVLDFKTSENGGGGTGGSAASSAGNINIDVSRQVPTAADNRPKNVTVNYFIKINRTV